MRNEWLGSSIHICTFTTHIETQKHSDERLCSRHGRSKFCGDRSLYYLGDSLKKNELQIYK